MCERSDTNPAAAARNSSMDAANNYTKFKMIKTGGHEVHRMPSTSPRCLAPDPQKQATAQKSYSGTGLYGIDGTVNVLTETRSSIALADSNSDASHDTRT